MPPLVPILWALALSARVTAFAQAPTGAPPPDAFLGRSAVDALPAASVRVDSRRDEMVIELPPVDVAGAHGLHAGMLRLAAHRVDVAVDGAFYRFRVDVMDRDGRLLPPDRLHHVILFDPDHRELFEPIVQRVLAAGKETGEVSVPWLLFGVPLRRGQRLILSSMISNPDAAELRGARLRVVLSYVRSHRPWPLHRAYPWSMDVAWPLGGEGGTKAFDLPPGRSERSWEGSPAIPGRIVGLGGHVHDHALRLQLWDVTQGTLLWDAAPITDSAGRALGLPRAYFYRWYRLGVRVSPQHRYRVTVVYDNPTGATIRSGGMGSVSGLIVPDREWPRVDPVDSIYRRDLDYVLRNMGGVMENMHGAMR